jgi:hypothetical protein
VAVRSRGALLRRDIYDDRCSFTAFTRLRYIRFDWCRLRSLWANDRDLFEFVDGAITREAAALFRQVAILSVPDAGDRAIELISALPNPGGAAPMGTGADAQNRSLTFKPGARAAQEGRPDATVRRHGAGADPV